MADTDLIERELRDLDAEAMKKAAFAVFAKANENNLKPETIKSLWPSQHYPHWDGLAEAAISAYREAAPSQSPAPGVVTDDGLEQFTAYFVKNYPGPDTIIYDPKWHAPRIFRAAKAGLASLSQPAKGEREGGE